MVFRLDYAEGDVEDYEDLEGLSVFHRCINPANMPAKVVKPAPKLVPAKASLQPAVATIEDACSDGQSYMCIGVRALARVLMSPLSVRRVLNRGGRAASHLGQTLASFESAGVTRAFVLLIFWCPSLLNHPNDAAVLRTMTLQKMRRRRRKRR